MSALPLHFEFYGTVNKVLRELGEDVPIYLPEQPPEFLANLNRLIKKVAIENQWMKSFWISAAIWRVTSSTT